MNTVEPVEEFEALLEKLREQVTTMESNQLPLNEAIDAYERSVELANKCHSLLENAELRIQRIDASTSVIQEAATLYEPYQFNAAALLLGDDDDLMDLIDDE